MLNGPSKKWGKRTQSPSRCPTGSPHPQNRYFFKKNFIYYLFIMFIFGCVGSSFLCEGFLQLRRVGATLHRGKQMFFYRKTGSFSFLVLLHILEYWNTIKISSKSCVLFSTYGAKMYIYYFPQTVFENI